ncbi:MAG: sigma-70 family RNA polymerase sigma factor [Candidatus Viridilinea halotolerans]|uniref:Sigma-70 family RNA polymerase sigma factor n=1 Tax=Candidatus Viridilinea halotolerans TaxID=2491704 RepID=A0A426TWX5_9CHLR|nr:MAG: sigma-70 family RNA polymerase sigma factor [Candidatus Viridilinea halotolerans]
MQRPNHQQAALDQVIEECRRDQAQPQAPSVQAVERTACWELFRRWLLLQNQAAATAAVQQFEKLVAYWLKPFGTERDADLRMDLVSDVWLLFVKYLSGERFNRFQSLDGVLLYLKKCTITVIKNAQRRQQREQLFQQQMAIYATNLALTPAESAIVQRLDDQERLKMLLTWLAAHATPQERRIFTLSFLQKLKPQQIVAQFPDEFSHVEMVRQIKENLLKRIRRALGGSEG